MNATAARLVYDSAHCSVLVGVRAGLSDGRSLSYRGAGLTVDLVLSSEESDSGFAFGQVFRSADCSPVAGAIVGLDGQPSICTDELGQFALTTGILRSARQLRVRTAEDQLACTISPMG